jgi:low temperature requirement protein LtrA
MRGVYWLGLSAAVVTFADAALYLMVIRNQDSPAEWGTVRFIAALIVLAGVLTAVGSVAEGTIRAALLGGATPILLVLGYLGAFSIGPPLFLAGMVTGIGALSAKRERPPSRRPAPRPRSASSRP